jgi:hypothetical protein
MKSKCRKTREGRETVTDQSNFRTSELQNYKRNTEKISLMGITD